MALATVFALTCCNAVHGTIDATSFGEVAGAAVVVGHSVEVILSTDLSECSDVTKGVLHGSTRSITLILQQTGQTGQPEVPTSTGQFVVQTDPGQTTLPANERAVTCSFRSIDSSCAVIDQATASGGTVQVSAINLSSGGAVGGSFDLTFPHGHLTGTFSVPICPLASGSTFDADQGAYPMRCQ